SRFYSACGSVHLTLFDNNGVNPMRFLVALFAVFLSLAACAEQSSQKYVAGQHYIVLEQPVRTVDPKKIEVAEVFSYHCGHCFNFEPILQAWEKQQPDDVVVVQTPAIWNAQMENLARRSEEHTSELQSRENLVCRLLLEKKK